MESKTITILGHALQQFKEEKYVHRIILHENSRSKLNEMVQKMKPNFQDCDELHTEFSFSYGELLPSLEHHSFWFHFPSQSRNEFVLKEYFTQSSRPIMIGSVQLGFLNKNGEQTRTVELKRRCLPSTQEWCVRSNWSDQDAEIKIIINVVRGWTRTLLPTIVQYRPGKLANTGKTSDYTHYFLNIEGSDVEIRCGGTKIPAHKFVLMLNPVFEKMLQPIFKEGIQNVVEMNTIDVSILLLLLEFIYTGDVDTDELEAKKQKELLVSAHQYMIDELKIDCEYSLGNKLICQRDIMKIIELYKFAVMYDAKVLQDFCKAWFKTTSKKYITSPEMFLEITKLAPDLVFAAYTDKPDTDIDSDDFGVGIGH